MPETGPLIAGAGGQLACWTVEGLIRAHVRGVHQGITTAAGLVWDAYLRFGRLRGEVPGAVDRSDGWLAAVPAFAERRGSAPATVAALRGGRIGTVAVPAGDSVGAHAETRTLPAGLCPWGDGPAALGAELAATTHLGAAVTAAALGADLIAELVRGASHEEAVAVAATAPERLGLAPGGIDLRRALVLARTGTTEARIMRGLAGDASGVSALTGGLYAAASASIGGIREALLFAATAGDGGHATAVAGALLGAQYGPERLPVDWLSRLELVWPADLLARDL